MAKKKVVSADAVVGPVGTPVADSHGIVAGDTVDIPKDTKNGITRPTAGTATGKVWEIADGISYETNVAATRKPVLEACKSAGINDSTAQTQFGRWRAYHGLVTARSAKVAGTPVAPVAPVATVE